VLVLKNCRLANDEVYDIKIEDSKIIQIVKNIDCSDVSSVIDVNEAYVLAGIVDLNVSLKDNMLSMSHISRLQQKALRSGITSFALMPNFEPMANNATFMELLNEIIESSSPVVLGVKAVDEDRLYNISRLINKGAEFIQESSSISSNLIRRILQYSNMKSVPFFCFCDDPSLNDDGVMNEGDISAKLGLLGISKVGEISSVARVCAMAEYYQSKVLFQSLSLSKSLDIINKAKSNNPNLYTEVSIHHLILNDSACLDFNTTSKIHPPLRDEKERLMLIEDLKSGKIDTITSLHSPKSIVYKDVPFADAAYGIDAMENFLSICYRSLVESGIISLSKLSEMISFNPAKILGLKNIGKVEEGYIADLVIFDPKEAKILNTVCKGVV
jgi:dihydroorotase